MNRKPAACLILLAAVVCMTVLTCCVEEEQAPPAPALTPSPMAMGAMRLTSMDFEDGAMIPQRFTCEGRNINPTLIIENIPAGTKSMVLTVEDLDAPRGTFVHWVVYNIPVMSRINEDSVPGTQGISDYGGREYQGPCPPSGTHRYIFTIYALDTEPFLGEMATKDALETAMQGHVLASAELIGVYEKGG